MKLLLYIVCLLGIFATPIKAESYLATDLGGMILVSGSNGYHGLGVDLGGMYLYQDNRNMPAQPIGYFPDATPYDAKLYAETGYPFPKRSPAECLQLYLDHMKTVKPISPYGK